MTSLHLVSAEPQTSLIQAKGICYPFSDYFTFELNSIFHTHKSAFYQWIRLQDCSALDVKLFIDKSVVTHCITSPTYSLHFRSREKRNREKTKSFFKWNVTITVYIFTTFIAIVSTSQSKIKSLFWSLYFFFLRAFRSKENKLECNSSAISNGEYSGQKCLFIPQLEKIRHNYLCPLFRSLWGFHKVLVAKFMYLAKFNGKKFFG